MTRLSIGLLTAILMIGQPAPAQSDTTAPRAGDVSGGSAIPSKHVMPDDASAKYVSLREWTKRVEAEIGQTLRYPRAMGAEEGSFGSGGVVRVKFNCTAGGGTANVSIRKTSGSRLYDAEALRTVSKLLQMHPLPTGMRNEQGYEAIIVFGTSNDGTFRQHTTEARAETQRRTNWFPQNRTKNARYDEVAAK